jgi:hypothetical protein
LVSRYAGFVGIVMLCRFVGSVALCGFVGGVALCGFFGGVFTVHLFLVGVCCFVGIVVVAVRGHLWLLARWGAGL